jgi:hypothetical protein
MDENNMSFPVGPNGESVYFSATSPSQATVTVASTLPVPGALYRVIAYNPNGAASNPITFTITNTLQAPAFLNPGPLVYVGGGSFSVVQTAQSSGITWTIAPTTAVTLSSASDAGVTLNVSDGIAIASPTNYTLTATDTAVQSTSQVFTIQNTFTAPAFVNPGTKSFNNGGSFAVSQTNANTGQLTWSISPTNGVTLSGASKTGVTVTVATATPISTSTYTLTATNPTPTSCVQPFSLTNTLVALYSMSFPFTFTNMGAVGRSGPTSITYGTSTPGYNTGFVLTLSTTGMQLWTVPFSRSYTFTLAGSGYVTGTYVWGGLGWYNYTVPGAVGTTTLSLTAGHVIRILVGQPHNSVISTYGRLPGCGGTFIYNDTTSTLLAVAGGAGGSSQDNTNPTGAGTNADPYTNCGGKALNGSTTTSGGTPPPASGAGGTGGNGGQGSQQSSPGNPGGAGGGGYFTGGGNASSGQANGGQSFLAGGLGGLGGVNPVDNGGFGCGGGSGNIAGGGGGGGYSGGGGGATAGAGYGGGGGGSYTVATWTSIAASNTGNGYVTVT